MHQCVPPNNSQRVNFYVYISQIKIGGRGRGRGEVKLKISHFFGFFESVWQVGICQISPSRRDGVVLRKDVLRKQDGSEFHESTPNAFFSPKSVAYSSTENLSI